MIDEKKTKYIENLQAGDIIAFEKSNGKTISAKVISADEHVIIEDKLNHTYKILKSDILWVKTNSTWPKYIMNRFKEENREDE